MAVRSAPKPKSSGGLNPQIGRNDHRIEKLKQQQRVWMTEMAMERQEISDSPYSEECVGPSQDKPSIQCIYYWICEGSVNLCSDNHGLFYAVQPNLNLLFCLKIGASLYQKKPFRYPKSTLSISVPTKPHSMNLNVKFAYRWWDCRFYLPHAVIHFVKNASKQENINL